MIAMRNLELRDIAGYLPYGLKMEHRSIDCCGDKFTCIRRIRLLCEDYVTFEDAYDYYFDDSDCDNPAVKPLLRPMSDLTKPILPDGRIPIVELAKLVEPTKKWVFDKQYYQAVSDTGDQFYVLHKEGKLVWFDLAFINSAGESEGNQIENITDIFDKLHEWHFDYRGLIEAGLAVDVNTVDNQ